MIATGIRWDESNGRKDRNTFEAVGNKKKNAVRVSDEKMLLTDNEDTRRLFEKCEMKAKAVVNPVIDWKDEEIWNFYRSECPYHNPLYDMGFTRVGCIGCPMASKKRYTEFQYFPTYRQAYISAFERMLKERQRRNLEIRWKSGIDVFDWWMEDKNIDGQYSMNFDGIDLVGFNEKGN